MSSATLSQVPTAVCQPDEACILTLRDRGSTLVGAPLGWQTGRGRRELRCDSPTASAAPEAQGWAGTLGMVLALGLSVLGHAPHPAPGGISLSVRSSFHLSISIHAQTVQSSVLNCSS